MSTLREGILHGVIDLQFKNKDVGVDGGVEQGEHHIYKELVERLALFLVLPFLLGDDVVSMGTIGRKAMLQDRFHPYRRGSMAE